jgi:polysaccharide biosynthesis/export protein
MGRQYTGFCCCLIATLIGLLQPPAAHAQMATTTNAYTLGPGDLIEISLLNQADPPAKVRIDADNSVVLPLIGRIIIGGLSATDARQQIEDSYVTGKYLVKPIVRLDVLAYESQKVSILGAVGNQALLPLDRSYTLTEILARAGGLSPDAGDSAIILHKSGSISREVIDLSALLDGSTTAPTILTGDTIIIPKAPTISVVGAVARAGVFRLTRGMTTLQAIAAAGDITRMGSMSDIKVRRSKPGTGTRQLMAIQLDDLLQDGDIIAIKERIF